MNAVFGVSGSWIRLLLLHSQQTHMQAYSEGLRVKEGEIWKGHRTCFIFFPVGIQGLVR